MPTPWFAALCIALTPWCWWVSRNHGPWKSVAYVAMLGIFGALSETPAVPEAPWTADRAAVEHENRQLDQIDAQQRQIDAQQRQWLQQRAADALTVFDYPPEAGTNVHWHCDRGLPSGIPAPGLITVGLMGVGPTECSWRYPDGSIAPPPAHPGHAMPPMKQEPEQ